MLFVPMVIFIYWVTVNVCAWLNACALMLLLAAIMM
jgi:hypothetical protein